jgi:hypothetical protein
MSSRKKPGLLRDTEEESFTVVVNRTSPFFKELLPGPQYTGITWGNEELSMTWIYPGPFMKNARQAVRSADIELIRQTFAVTFRPYE